MINTHKYHGVTTVNILQQVCISFTLLFVFTLAMNSQVFAQAKPGSDAGGWLPGKTDNTGNVGDVDNTTGKTIPLSDDCPSDPNKTEPGVCGCGVPDTDLDSDGTPNCNDECPRNPNLTTKNVCGTCSAIPTETCDGLDNDCDGVIDNGVLNACGACGAVPTETCDGADNDCDGSTDEDVLNACGACSVLNDTPGASCSIANMPACATGAFACTVAGELECQVTVGADADGDKVADCVDNCANAANTDQADADGDSIGDACEERSASVCGDNNTSLDEECDDGNTSNNDICLSNCTLASCGDGYIHTDFEECDGSAPAGFTCSDSCELVAIVAEAPTCTEDQQETCTVSGALGVCAEGLRLCVKGEWGECTAAINPSRELCDELDNNCDGIVDNTRLDQDDDGVNACEDCDDNDATIFPGAEEICDGLDNDCDLATLHDETCDCVDSATEFFGIDEGECSQGEKECVNGQWSVVYDGVLPVTEICNSLDDDCDGMIDNVPDLDGDGVTECENDCNDRDPLVGPQITETCDGVDNDCDGLTDEGFDLDKDGYLSCEDDCDDANATAYPNATELFDDTDNNCDGTIDEGEVCEENETRPCGIDTGECSQGVQTCSNNAWGRCQGASGRSREICDTLDNDCDGLTDEDFDRDKDGYVRCVDDCNDAVAGISPAATEACDGIDNNCDQQIDEGCDCVDGDTQVIGKDVGECSAGAQVCIGGAWTVQTEAFAGDIEACDFLDNDCNGAADDGVTNACGTCGDLPVDCLDGTDDDCDGVDGEDTLDAECFVAVSAPVEAPADTNPELLVDDGDEYPIAPPVQQFGKARVKGGGSLGELFGCSLNISMGATSDPISVLWGLSGFIGLWFLRRWIVC